MIWGIAGSIPTRVEGNGLFLSNEGGLFVAVGPAGENRIQQIHVKLEDKIQQNQLLVTLENPQLDEEVKNTEIYLQKLRDEYSQLQHTGQDEITKRKQDLGEQNQILENSVKQQSEKLEHVTELLNVRKTAKKKGLETLQGLMETERDYYETQKTINEANNQLSQNKVQEANFIDQWNERWRALELKIQDEQYKLANLRKQLALSKEIRSPIAGIVTHIEGSIGDVVKNGEPVISIANQAMNIDALIYLSPQDGKRIRVGMKALVTPTTIKREEYGSILGKVKSVSEYPVTSESIMALLKNEDLVKQFTRDGAPIAVRIALVSDITTHTGLAWTSSRGPSQRITPGTLANARIIIEEKRPIALIIPMIKKTLGLE